MRIVTVSSPTLIFLSSLAETPTCKKVKKTLSSAAMTSLACTRASKLESAMNTLIEVFQSYASKGGNRYKLDFLELRRLVQGELSSYLQDSWDCRRVAEIMADLDKDRDGGVSFEEYVALVTQLTVFGTSYFKDYTPVLFHCGQMKDGRFQRL